MVATLIGVVSDGFGLAHIIRGEPTPSPTPTPVLAGELKLDRVTEYATFSEWLDELRSLRGQPGVQRVLEREYSPAELDTIGTLLVLDIQLEGYTGRDVRLLWSLLDGDGRRIGDDAYSDREATAFEPEAVRRDATFPIWLPPAPRDGGYRVRLALLDDEDVQLDSVDSARFEALGPERLR